MKHEVWAGVRALLLKHLASDAGARLLGSGGAPESCFAGEGVEVLSAVLYVWCRVFLCTSSLAITWSQAASPGRGEPVLSPGSFLAAIESKSVKYSFTAEIAACPSLGVHVSKQGTAAVWIVLL